MASYQKMNKAQLFALAKEKNLEVEKTATKDTLLRILTEAEISTSENTEQLDRELAPADASSSEEAAEETPKAEAPEKAPAKATKKNAKKSTSEKAPANSKAAKSALLPKMSNRRQYRPTFSEGRIKVQTKEEVAKLEILQSLDENIRKILKGKLVGRRLRANEKKEMPLAIIAFSGLNILIRAEDFFPHLPGYYPTDAINCHNMLGQREGANIEFVIKYADFADSENPIIIGDRLEAMKIRSSYFWNKKTKKKDADGMPVYEIREGSNLNANVISVQQNWLLAEIYGVETTIDARELSHSFMPDVREHFKAGDIIPVKIIEVYRDDDFISFTASHKARIPDKKAAKFRRCMIGDTYKGVVTNIIEGKEGIRIFVNMNPDSNDDATIDILARLGKSQHSLPSIGQKVDVLINGKDETSMNIWGVVTFKY